MPDCLPLARSLEPLADESLPGFLLRLSHRLDLSPLRLAQNIGLEPAGNAIPMIRILHLTPHQAESFAAATRLSIDEVHHLTLGAMGTSYPYARMRDDLSRPDRHLAGAEPWLLTGASRYCPQCLAGDGSPIQNRFGGPWRRTWRLPVVFACLEHHRLLNHLCPTCRRPAHSRDARFTRSIVLRAGTIEHPLSCRALDPDGHPCPGRFDKARPRRRDVDLPMLLDLQAHLLERLAQGERALAFFERLRADAARVQRVWSRTSRPVPARLASVADDLRRYLSPHSGRRRTDQASRSLQHRNPDRIYDIPPLDAAACGALLAMAAEPPNGGRQ